MSNAPLRRSVAASTASWMVNSSPSASCAGACSVTLTGGALGSGDAAAAAVFASRAGAFAAAPVSAGDRLCSTSGGAPMIASVPEGNSSKRKPASPRYSSSAYDAKHAADASEEIARPAVDRALSQCRRDRGLLYRIRRTRFEGF